MQTKYSYNLLALILMTTIFYASTINAQQKIAKGGYGDMLYPFVHDYDQTLTYKIGLDYGKPSDIKKLDADEVLQVIKRVDNLTRGLPKIVYLVGWQ